MFLPRDTYSIRPLFWFWLPWALALGVAAINPFLYGAGSANMYSENGFLEALQWPMALAACGVALSCLRYASAHWLKLWIIVGALGSLYIGLEEMSYGQHLLKWETPEHWAAINDQNETNLHNTSSWLDQKPRMLLMIGVIIGGAVLPVVNRFRAGLLPAKFSVIYPSPALFWVSTLTLLSYLAKKFDKGGLFTIYNRSSEVNECFIYYFLLLYFIMLRQQLKPA